MTVDEAVAYLDMHPEEVAGLRLYLTLGRAYIDPPVGPGKHEIQVNTTRPVTIAESIIATGTWLQAQLADQELEQATVEQLEAELDAAARAGIIEQWTHRFRPANLKPYDVVMSGGLVVDRLNCADSRKAALLAAVREVRKLQGGAA